MSTDSIHDAIDRQDWIEPVEAGLQTAVESVFASGETGHKAEEFLHGKWLGHPLHPALIDLPLGAWTVSAVLDTMDAVNGDDHYADAAQAAVGMGLVGAVGAAASGLTDWHRTDGKAHRVGVVHGLLNVGGVALYGTSWMLRRARNYPAARAVGWAALAVVTFSAWLGGSLVYNLGVGVSEEPRKALPKGTGLDHLPRMDG